MRKRQDFIIEMSAMLFGTLLMAFTYYHINFQNHLSEGGFVGLALLGKYVLDIPPALGMILLDIPVLLVALFLKGKKFIINTVVAAAMFSLFYALMERYSTLVIDLHHNLLVAALISGVLTGFGAGIVLRYGGATGGDDAISVLISEWSGLKGRYGHSDHGCRGAASVAGVSAADGDHVHHSGGYDCRAGHFDDGRLWPGEASRETEAAQADIQTCNGPASCCCRQAWQRPSREREVGVTLES